MFENLFKSDEGVTDPIQDQHEKVIVPKAKATTKSLAQKNLPALTGDQLAPYLEGVRGMYENLYHRYNTNLQVENSKDLTSAEQVHSTSTREYLEKKVRNFTDGIRRATLEREAMPEIKQPDKHNWTAHGLVFFLALTESLFTRRALTIFDSNNNLFLIIILIGLTGFFMLLPAVLVKLYHATKEKKHRFLIWGGVALILVSGFAVLGIMRSVFLKNMGLSTMDDVQAGSSITLKPIYFVGINLMFLLVSTLIYAFMVPDEKEKALVAKAKALDDKIAKMERDLERAEQDLQRIPERLYQGQVRKSEMAAESRRLAERINSLYRECISIFVEENTLYRNDHGRPDCFDAPVPDLIFTNSKK
jgi:hypothetical protein